MLNLIGVEVGSKISALFSYSFSFDPKSKSKSKLVDKSKIPILLTEENSNFGWNNSGLYSINPFISLDEFEDLIVINPPEKSIFAFIFLSQRVDSLMVKCSFFPIKQEKSRRIMDLNSINLKLRI